jgi:hypothetical protein
VQVLGKQVKVAGFKVQNERLDACAVDALQVEPPAALRDVK